ncbi:MAG: response regulator transcription factor [Haliea sp.]|nr:MAG: response regulator transcription factor [Haliea sp.]
MRVLLAEDNLHMREFVKEALTRIPDAVVVYETASHLEARQWLAAHPDGWDVALVDMFLTEGNGFRILKDCAVRQPHQRVVVMSNYLNDTVKARVLAEGADAFLPKSSDPEELIACLGDAGQR